MVRLRGRLRLNVMGDVEVDMDGSTWMGVHHGRYEGCPSRSTWMGNCHGRHEVCSSRSPNVVIVKGDVEADMKGCPSRSPNVVVVKGDMDDVVTVHTHPSQPSS